MAKAGRLRRSRLRRLSEHAGLLIAGAALAALVLGMLGCRAFVPGRTFTDYLYRSLQLFVVYVETNGAPNPEHTPVLLDIARFLAPAAAAAASIRAVLALFGQRAARAWVRYVLRDHVVVCGLGPLGARLAGAFRDGGFRVVAIEPEASSSAVHEARACGVIVLVGDPTDRSLLLKAGLLTARYLVVASDDDGTNADVALAARDAADRRRRPLPCFVHVVHPGLAGLLGEASLTAAAGGPLRLEFFNPWESVPPMVLDAFPPDGLDAADGGRPGHMLVVGPGRLGQALVAHAARRWADQPAESRARRRVTMVGAGAEAAAAELARRYPKLPEVCELKAVEVGLGSAKFEQAAYLDGPSVTSAYVTGDDDPTSLGAALALARVVPHLRIVVLTTQHSGMATLVSGIRAGSSPLAVFDVLEETCRPDILLNGTIELLAQALHRDYVRQQAGPNGDGDNPSRRAWDDLPETTREANRAQAAGVGAVLAAIGCRIQPWTDWTSGTPAFSSDEIERMAEVEHDRWCRERAAEGWTYAPTKDDVRRTTPYLVPWLDLAEDVKELDRTAVRAFPGLLTFAGFAIVRAPSATAPT